MLNINDQTTGGDSAHGIANARVLRAYGDWIAANSRAVAGFDPRLPPLAQLDRLSDAQMRAVARSLDPIARQGLVSGLEDGLRRANVRPPFRFRLGSGTPARL